MRIHTLESTGGLTYAQMGRFTAKPGTPAKFTDGHGGTSIDTYAVLDPKTQQPVSNGLRNLWVTETALTTALNTSYMAEQLSLFGIVVGIALLLAGIGFAILAIGGALRTNAAGCVRPSAKNPPRRSSRPRRRAYLHPHNGRLRAARRLLLLQHSLVERVANELGAAREPELLHDVRAVRLGRSHRDVELRRDLLVRVPEREQTQDLALPVGQRILVGAALRLGLGKDETRADSGCT